MGGHQIDWNALFERASAARENAYAPYSGFNVGAAVATETGEIFTGCNVENSSFGLTICAERVAVVAAVQAGFRNLVGVAIVAETDHPPPPCGACRQVLAEFNPGFVVRSGVVGGVQKEWSLAQLLPSPFVQAQRAKHSTWNILS
jgi:cytidine deaminase